MKRKTIILLCVLCCLQASTHVFADSDVSQMSNVIYVESATVAPGSASTLTVMLKSTSTTTSAFQFDLYLPAGVTVDGDVSAAIRKAGLETSGHQLYAAWMKSGACRVICYSLDNTKLKGKAGEAAVIDIRVDGSVKPGTYPVILRSVEIARTDGRASYKVSKVQTSIVIQPENNTPTDIQLAGTEQSADDATYNVLGQKVKKLRRGQIGVKKGKKTIEK